MRCVQLILACFWLAVTNPSHAFEYFYANASHPSAGQITISPSSIGAHRSVPASMCGMEEPLRCYKSKVFSLALPRGDFPSKSWIHEDFRYKVETRTKLSFLGEELEVIEIQQLRAGKLTMSFVYSLERGLISFQAASRGAPSFVLENRCGLLAPDTCVEK